MENNGKLKKVGVGTRIAGRPSSNSKSKSKKKTKKSSKLEPIMEIKLDLEMTSKLQVFKERFCLIRTRQNDLITKFWKRKLVDGEGLHEEFMELISLTNYDAEGIQRAAYTYPIVFYNLAVQYYQFKRFCDAQHLVEVLLKNKHESSYLNKMLRLLYIAVLSRQQDFQGLCEFIEKFESSLRWQGRTYLARSQSPEKSKRLLKLQKVRFDFATHLSLQQSKTAVLLRLNFPLIANRCYRRTMRFIKNMPKSLCETNIIKLVQFQLHLKLLKQFRAGNYEKTLYLIKRLAHGENPPLGLCTMTNPRNYKSFLETGDNLSIILNNNAACCYEAMGKPLCAGWFLERACDECDNILYKNKKVLPIHCLAYNSKYDAMYNFAVVSYQSKFFYRSFYYFWLTSKHAFTCNPKIWIQLAKCCIQINSRKHTNEKCPEDSLEDPFREFWPTCLKTSKQIPFTPGNVPPLPTTKFGLACSQLASKLICPEVIMDAGGVLEVPPCDPIRNMKTIVKLRNTALLIVSYFAVQEREYDLAFTTCMRLLKMSNISRTNRCLVTIFLVKALIGLDKVILALKIFEREASNEYLFLSPTELKELFDKDPATYAARMRAIRIYPFQKSFEHDMFIYEHVSLLHKMGRHKAIMRILQRVCSTNGILDRKLSFQITTIAKQVLLHEKKIREQKTHSHNDTRIKREKEGLAQSSKTRSVQAAKYTKVKREKEWLPQSSKIQSVQTAKIQSTLPAKERSVQQVKERAANLIQEQFLPVVKDKRFLQSANKQLAPAVQERFPQPVKEKPFAQNMNSRPAEEQSVQPLQQAPDMSTRPTHVVLDWSVQPAQKKHRVRNKNTRHYQSAQVVDRQPAQSIGIQSAQHVKSQAFHPLKSHSTQSVQSHSTQSVKIQSVQPYKQPPLQPVKQPNLNPVKQPYFNPVKPPNFNQAKQPTHFNQAKQPTNFNQAKQPTNFNQANQPTYFNQAKQPTNFNQAKQPTNFNQAKQPTNFNQAKQPTNFNQSKQPTNFNQAKQPTNFNTVKQPYFNPVKQPYFNPVKQPYSNSVNQPYSNSVNQPYSNSVNQPYFNTVKQPYFNPVKQPYFNPVKQPYFNPVKQPYSNPVKQPYFNPVKQPYINPEKQPYIQPVKQQCFKHLKQRPFQNGKQTFGQPAKEPSSNPLSEWVMPNTDWVSPDREWAA